MIARYGVLRSRSLLTMDLPFPNLVPASLIVLLPRPRVWRAWRDVLSIKTIISWPRSWVIHDGTHGAHETMDLRFNSQ
jgi:hypothetical protein